MSYRKGERRMYEFAGGRVRWHIGKIEDWLPEFKANYFDAAFGDPPYDLGSTGFMGAHWDRTGVAFQPGTWEAVARVLQPGALSLMFGGARTWHRLAVALEDGGLKPIETILHCYGSGMPKGPDIGRLIDEAVREVVGKHPNPCGVGEKGTQSIGGAWGEGDVMLTAPATPLAKVWDGYNPSLKPAYEPVVLMGKGEPRAINVLAGRLQLCHGVNSNGRFKPSDPQDRGNGTPGATECGKTPFPARQTTPEHHAHCRKTACHPRCVIRALGGGTIEQIIARGTPRLRYTGKASRAEREAGLTGMPKLDCDNFGDDAWGKENRDVQVASNNHSTLKPIEACTYYASLLLPPKTKAKTRILVPFAGVASEVIACLLAGWDEVWAIEQDWKWAEIARRRIEHFLKG